MKKFPYKDEDTGAWIYDSVPEKMQLATCEKQIKINTLILFQATISSLKGYFIAAKVNHTNIDCVKYYLRMGRVYIKKTGI